MQPHILVANGHPLQLGGNLPDRISSLFVLIPYGVAVPTAQTPMLKQWLNSLIDRLDCEYVTVEDSLVLSSDLRGFV